MEQKWSKIWQSYQVQILKTWNTCRNSLNHFTSQTPRNTCASSLRSLSRIIRTHEPGPASDGSGTRNQLQEVRRTKFREISSKPRGSTVRWLLWRWPCQAKSAPPRCTPSGLAWMPVPCGNTSSQANPASKTKNDDDKNSPRFLKKMQQEKY